MLSRDDNPYQNLINSAMEKTNHHVVINVLKTELDRSIKPIQPLTSGLSDPISPLEPFYSLDRSRTV